MLNTGKYTSLLCSIDTVDSFNGAALDLFRYQYEHNPVYRSFVQFLGRSPNEIQSISDIPFLPIESFKHHSIKTGEWEAVRHFTSSGTTSANTSIHFLREEALYQWSYHEAFRRFYADSLPLDEKFTILALLPGYLERTTSSLVDMVKGWMDAYGDDRSGFVLNDLQHVNKVLLQNAKDQRPTLLIGVSFALLDLVEKYRIHFPELLVMETGGMKGRRKELIREELHALIKDGLGVTEVHSEYGMTELLSQAYSFGDGRFHGPPWMRIQIREIDDPFASPAFGKTGGINIIDLANRDSCAFLSTSDLGRVYQDGSFEVLGRFDHSDVRGCNLMVI